MEIVCAIGIKCLPVARGACVVNHLTLKEKKLQPQATMVYFCHIPVVNIVKMCAILVLFRQK